MDLVRKQTYITSAQDRAVKRLAKRSHSTEAEIIRQALDSWLARVGASGDADPFASLIGFVEGPEEIDHDDIYR